MFNVNCAKYSIIILVAVIFSASILIGTRIRYKNLLVTYGDQSRRQGSGLTVGAVLILLIGISISGVVYLQEANQYQVSSLSLLQLYDPDQSSDDCGHLGPGGNVRITGIGRHWQGFVQCRHRVSDYKQLTSYRFRLPEEVGKGSRLTNVTGQFFIDEQGAFHSNARVTWSVVYGRQQLCQARARWKKPGQCRPTSEVTVGDSNTLEIIERIESERPQRTLFAGLWNPELVVAKRCSG
jgi:hypothetical protein